MCIYSLRFVFSEVLEGEVLVERSCLRSEVYERVERPVSRQYPSGSGCSGAIECMNVWCAVFLYNIPIRLLEI